MYFLTGSQTASTFIEGENINIFSNAPLYISNIKLLINTVFPDPDGAQIN